MTDLLQGLQLGVVEPPRGAVLALVIVLVTAVLLTIGWRLAVRRRFVAHRWVQTTAVVLNASLALTWMVASLVRNVLPEVPAKLGQADYLTAVVHAAVGLAATAFGVYVVLAASKLLPERVSFTTFRPVMRSSYALYLAGTATGVLLYVVAYVGF